MTRVKVSKAASARRKAPVHPALAAIRTESARVGWPLRFATDLAHDATAIASMQPREPFTWCLYPDGTHLGRVEVSRGHHGLTMCMVADTFENCRFYVWDGKELSQHSAESADSTLSGIAGRRYQVRPARTCSLVPHYVADRTEACHLANAWQVRYGEAFIVEDTWGAPSVAGGR